MAIKITRDQLARFLTDPEEIKQFEKLIQTVNNIDLFELADVANQAAGGQAAAAEAAAALTRIDLASLPDVDASGAAAGYLLIYDATAGRWTASALTAGANINITNGDASITIAVTGLGTMAFENTGVSGSFTAMSGETVTVTDGIVTSIV